MGHLASVVLVAFGSCLVAQEVSDARLEPVLVQMVDQRLPRPGAFAAFCAEHRETVRSALRGPGIADLRSRSDASWSAVRATVDELVETGAVRDVERLWIVNAFACDATPAAMHRLVELDAVAAVHHQRLPGAAVQHRPEPLPAALLARRHADLQGLLDTWRDDSADPIEDRPHLPWNVKRIHAHRAWATGATGQGVVVAVVCDGVLITPWLRSALWRNLREDLDGVDDDGNGLVDDVFGWDFDSGTPCVIGDGQRSPGTILAGIVAGRAVSEHRIVSGVAPRARLMLLRGPGRFRCLEYAAEHGADVVLFDFGWPSERLGGYRDLLRIVFEQLTTLGVLTVGGAGDLGESAPAGRQILAPMDVPCVLAVGGTVDNDEPAWFGSRGPSLWPTAPEADRIVIKPDLVAPSADFPMWHYQSFGGVSARPFWFDDPDDVGLVLGPRGTRFAAAHAAGVAALMWSVAPELTPWRLQQLIESSCADVSPWGKDVVYGSGLLYADAAVRAARGK